METLRVAMLISLVFVSGERQPFDNVKRRYTVTGGGVTDIKEVPYQAALITSDNFLMCGGSILNEKFVLTAVHCCGSIVERVRVGSNYFDKEGTVLKIKKKTVHPKYSYENVTDYDLCVLEVESSIPFSDSVKPIKIADSKPEPDSVVSFAGWGRTETGLFSQVLLSVEVPVVNDTLCKDVYPFIVSLNRVLCAGVVDKGLGGGDNGGGLTYKGEIVGVASYVNEYAEKGYANIFSSTTDSEMRAFIKDIADV